MWSGAGWSSPGDKLWIIRNDTDGTLSGTFAGYANGDPVGSYDGRQWRIYYGADAASGQLSGGNDVLLMAAAPVPEPSCLALLAVAAVLLLRFGKGCRQGATGCLPARVSQQTTCSTGWQAASGQPGGPGFDGVAAPPPGAWPRFGSRVRLEVAGEPRGRADTPGFDRWPETKGQQVTEVGVPPLPRNNTHKKPASFGAGFLLFLDLPARLFQQDQLLLFRPSTSRLPWPSISTSISVRTPMPSL